MPAPRARSRLSHLFTDVTALGMFATRMAILAGMTVATRLSGRATAAATREVDAEAAAGAEPALPDFKP